MNNAYKKIFSFFQLVLFFYIHTEPFKLGVENLSSSLMQKINSSATNTCNVGLITNQTGVNQQNIRTIDIIAQHGFNLRYIFVPEHGLNGTLAGKPVSDAVDSKTNIPILSLYGNGSGKMIQPEHIATIDALFFDIQDSGMRHYTYISTLLNTMKIAAEYNKPFIVLDRPNPLGSAMQGPLVDPDLISFISIAPIPLRHGLTIGELAHYFNEYIMPKKVSLHVIPMTGYDNKRGFAGPFLHQLSPNLKSLQSCYGYSFLGLLGEIKPFDVGVGTPLSFQCVMLPKTIKIPTDMWKRLQDILQNYGIQSSPYTTKKSNGLRLIFNAINDLKSFDLLLDLVHFFKQEGIPLIFSPTFDKAVGTKAFREIIEGTSTKQELYQRIGNDLTDFREKIKPLLLY